MQRAWAAPQPSLALALDVDAATSADSVVVDAHLASSKTVAFADLAQLELTPGRHTFSFEAEVGKPDTRLVLPPCAGKTPPRVSVDGRAPSGLEVGPAGQWLPLGPGRHRIELTLEVSGYERRIACGFAPRWGSPVGVAHGLRVLSFPSPRRASCPRCRPGQALVYLPTTASAKPPLLVGLHPWNGAIETYAAYAELLRAAEAHGVVLLFPDGLGNSLYTESAEEEVMAALDALQALVSFDEDHVALFGASMGGAGATTIGFHRPDRFASVTSLFGDSRYDLSTYVKALLPNEAAARRVNALDVADNARHLPVFLVHGDADKSSPLAQSTMLEGDLRHRGFQVQLQVAVGRGHESRLVTEQAHAIVERARRLGRTGAPTRVSYRSVRAVDRGAYGLRFQKSRADAEAFVDVERQDDSVVVLSARGVKSLHFARGSFGSATPLHVRFATGVQPVATSWEE